MTSLFENPEIACMHKKFVYYVYSIPCVIGQICTVNKSKFTKNEWKRAYILKFEALDTVSAFLDKLLSCSVSTSVLCVEITKWNTLHEPCL